MTGKPKAFNNYFKITGWFIICIVLFISLAMANPLWLRYPAISPDGSTIVFSYQGDLYQVPTHGGQAAPLTLHNAYDYSPVWSPDGKWIAFASDRYGNFDIYLIPSEGGPAKRLTYHSAGDFPTDFTPDGKAIIFCSTRLDDINCVQFPVGVCLSFTRFRLLAGVQHSY